MTFKLIFTGGVLFSSALHAFLLVAVILWYPNIVNKHDLEWNFLPSFLENENTYTNNNIKKWNDPNTKVNLDFLLFPDIVLYVESKKRFSKTKIEKKKKQLSVSSIILQADKLPDRLNETEFARKTLSGKVGEILTMLTPVKLLNVLPKKKILNLNAVELEEYHKQLEVFLSKRWEVPIHLIENELSVVIQFEITKSGRLIDSSIEESQNAAFNKTIQKLLKNLQFLPSLPESYPEDLYKFGVRFTPANFKL